LTSQKINSFLKETVESFFKNDDNSYIDNSNQALRFLAKFRSSLIANTLKEKYGKKIYSGPFQGMEFLDEVSEGCYIPKLLGIYESEIHSFIYYILEKKPDIIFNIGCAEGYYSVGLKKLLPETEIFSFDTDANAQNKSKILAEKNNVEINIEGLFEVDLLKKFNDKNVFLICDIEGEEINLFKPENIDLFKKITICAELHIKNGKHNKDIIPSLFKDTHSVEIIKQIGKNEFIVPDEISNFGHLDILLASWEWRSYPTPWLIAKPKL